MSAPRDRRRARRARRGLGMAETLLALAIGALVIAAAVGWTTQRIAAMAADRHGQAVVLATVRLASWYQTMPAAVLGAPGWHVDMPHGNTVRAVIGAPPGIWRRDAALGTCAAGDLYLASGANLVLHRNVQRGPNVALALAQGEVRVQVMAATRDCTSTSIEHDPPSAEAGVSGVSLHLVNDLLDPGIRNLVPPGAPEPGDRHLFAFAEIRRCDAAAADERSESHDIAEGPGGSCAFVAREGWVPDMVRYLPVADGNDPPRYSFEAELVGCAVKRTDAGRAARVALLAQLSLAVLSETLVCP